MIIARSDPKKLLNKRTELVSKCRHRNNFLFQIRFETQLNCFCFHDRIPRICDATHTDKEQFSRYIH